MVIIETNNFFLESESSTLKVAFAEKKKKQKCENKYTNKHSFNLSKSWKQKYFDSITYKNPETQ